MKPIVWTVAGSDSGGGAGIQADLHAFHCLFTHGCSVITTVTAQNSVAATGIFPLSGAIINQQLQSLLSDLPPKAIKIGLLSEPDQIEALIQFFEQWPTDIERPFVVWDPVLVSTQGDHLSHLSPELCYQLLPWVDLITPNQDELLWLTSLSAPLSAQEVRDAQTHEAIAQLQQQGAKHILVTGLRHDGIHLFRAHVHDLWVQDRQHTIFRQLWLDTPHTHGTGCTLSSAIAAFMAHGYPIEDALTLANSYVYHGLQTSHGIGQGPGPVAHTSWPQRLDCFPSVDTLPPTAQAHRHQEFLPLTYPIGLYPVVDSYEWVHRLLELGIQTIQLRIKKADQVQLEQEIVTAIQLARRYQAQLFINDHWQLAIKHGAYGIHLGQDDLNTADLQAIHQAGLRLGISTHGYAEIIKAYQHRPSYIALGHVFPTQTKSMPSKPQGVERLQRYAHLLAETGIPTVAIGGITLDRAPQVMQTGVQGIAVVTAITQAHDVEQAVRDLQACIQPQTTGAMHMELSHA